MGDFGYSARDWAVHGYDCITGGLLARVSVRCVAV